jgi:hypothetical protein
MAVYNFGMLTAGMPDPAMRQASTVVNDPAAARQAYLNDWQNRWNAATPTWIADAGGGSRAAPTPEQIAQNIANGADPYAASAPFYAPGSTDGRWDDSARRALDAEKSKGLAAFVPQLANQMVQQNAYTAAGGGSFLGGNINGSYATPNTGLDPNSSLNGMLNTQPWSLPGFGGPNGGASQAGFGGPQGNNAQPQGWGGPFTARNPWAAS